MLEIFVQKFGNESHFETMIESQEEEGERETVKITRVFHLGSAPTRAFTTTFMPSIFAIALTAENQHQLYHP